MWSVFVGGDTAESFPVQWWQGRFSCFWQMMTTVPGSECPLRDTDRDPVFVVIGVPFFIWAGFERKRRELLTGPVENCGQDAVIAILARHCLPQNMDGYKY